jgi:hypothetical protein
MTIGLSDSSRKTKSVVAISVPKESMCDISVLVNAMTISVLYHSVLGVYWSRHLQHSIFTPAFPALLMPSDHCAERRGFFVPLSAVLLPIPYLGLSTIKATLTMPYLVYGHITLKTPVLVRSPKLSNVEPGQYLDG